MMYTMLAGRGLDGNPRDVDALLLKQLRHAIESEGLK